MPLVYGKTVLSPDVASKIAILRMSDESTLVQGIGEVIVAKDDKGFRTSRVFYITSDGEDGDYYTRERKTYWEDYLKWLTDEEAQGLTEKTREGDPPKEEEVTKPLTLIGRIYRKILGSRYVGKRA